MLQVTLQDPVSTKVFLWGHYPLLHLLLFHLAVFRLVLADLGGVCLACMARGPRISTRSTEAERFLPLMLVLLGVEILLERDEEASSGPIGYGLALTFTSCGWFVTHELLLLSCGNSIHLSA